MTASFRSCSPTVVAHAISPEAARSASPKAAIPFDLRAQHLEPRPGLVLLAANCRVDLARADGALFSATPTESELTQGTRFGATDPAIPKCGQRHQTEDAARRRSRRAGQSPSLSHRAPWRRTIGSSFMVGLSGRFCRSRDGCVTTAPLIAGRWFYSPAGRKLARPNTARGSAEFEHRCQQGCRGGRATPGTASSGTAQVPGRLAHRPCPSRPRPGRMTSQGRWIDTGGPGIRDPPPAIHQVTTTEWEKLLDGRFQRTTVALRQRRGDSTVTSRLSWRQTDDTVRDAVFTHAPAENFVGVF